MIGCRFAIYPMAADYVEVILAAIRAMNADGMTVRTDSLVRCSSAKRSGFDTVRLAFEEAAWARTVAWIGALNEIISQWLVLGGPPRLATRLPELRSLLLRSIGAQT